MRVQAVITGNRRAAVDHLVKEGCKPVPGFQNSTVRRGKYPDGLEFILVDEADIRSVLAGWELCDVRYLFVRRLSEDDREWLKARLR